MDLKNLDSWTAAVSESTPSTIEKLSRLIDFSNPPDFFEFAAQQFERRNDKDGGGWDLLMDTQLILRAVGLPAVLRIKEAQELTRMAMEVDSLFDTKLLRRLLAHRLWPEEVPSDEVMRTLEVLETLPEPHRLSMTLLKFAKFPDRRVQSKVAKILGRCVDSVEVMEELFENPDRRVRANLLEGLGRRDSIELFLPLIERATKDQHARVSSLALALHARHGHAGAKALIRMRSKSKMDVVRKSAEFAHRIASGEELGPDVDRSLAVGGVVNAEPAMAAAVEEVHQ